MELPAPGNSRGRDRFGRTEIACSLSAGSGEKLGEDPGAKGMHMFHQLGLQGHIAIIGQIRIVILAVGVRTGQSGYCLRLSDDETGPTFCPCGVICHLLLADVVIRRRVVAIHGCHDDAVLDLAPIDGNRLEYRCIFFINQAFFHCYLLFKLFISEKYSGLLSIYERLAHYPLHYPLNVHAIWLLRYRNTPFRCVDPQESSEVPAEDLGLVLVRDGLIAILDLQVLGDLKINEPFYGAAYLSAIPRIVRAPRDFVRTDPPHRLAQQFGKFTWRRCSPRY